MGAGCGPHLRVFPVGRQARAQACAQVSLPQTECGHGVCTRRQEQGFAGFIWWQVVQHDPDDPVMGEDEGEERQEPDNATANGYGALGPERVVSQGMLVFERDIVSVWQVIERMRERLAKHNIAMVEELFLSQVSEVGDAIAGSVATTPRPVVVEA